MSGYTPGGCDHIGVVWEPPASEVERVACSYCDAPSGEPCRGRRGALLPHAIRYITHHDATCSTAVKS